MDPTRYFDHAATTPPSEAVIEAMMTIARGSYGNASSIHSWGQAARFAVEQARDQVARAIGAESPEEIVFTSGATESLNWVLRNAGPFVFGPTEHSAVRQTSEILNYPSFDDPANLAVDSEFGLALAKVCNETGEVFNLRPASPQPRSILCDATQAIGKVGIDLQATESNVDYLAFSAHKFYGPTGVGVLYARGQEFPTPLLTGGNHEWGFRAGTLNTMGIVGLGAAIEESIDRIEIDAHHARICAEALLNELAQPESDLWQYAKRQPEGVISHILPLIFEGIEGESLVVACDNAGYAISAGAACSSGSTNPSPSMIRLGLSDNQARGFVRVSFGRQNTPSSSAELGKLLRTEAKRLKNTNS